MTHTLKISYISCQTCHAKVHCDECEKQLEEAIMRMQGTNGASVQMGPKQVLIDSELDGDTIEEVLEDLGIFIV